MIRWLDETAQATGSGTLEYELPCILIIAFGQIRINNIKYSQADRSNGAGTARCCAGNVVVDWNTGGMAIKEYRIGIAAVGAIGHVTITQALATFPKGRILVGGPPAD